MNHKLSHIKDIQGIFIIFSTLFYFLIYAQFGFLEISRTVFSESHLKPIMSMMGIGGVIGSLLLTRQKKVNLVLHLTESCLSCLALSLFALFPVNEVELFFISFGIGFNLAIMTVATSTLLPCLISPVHYALKISLGVGLAYFCANIPSLFNASPFIKTVIMIFHSGVTFLVCKKIQNIKEHLTYAPKALKLIPEFFYQSYIGLFFIVTLFVLVLIDSHVFYVIQHNEFLKSRSWGSDSQLRVIGISHLMGAILAGVLIDHKKLLYVFPVTVLLFITGFWHLPLSQQNINLSSVFYATGISLYTVVLISFATLNTVDQKMQVRAAILYCVAGWVGSGLGIVSGESLNYISEIVYIILLISLFLSVRVMIHFRGKQCAHHKKISYLQQA